MKSSFGRNALVCLLVLAAAAVPARSRASKLDPLARRALLQVRSGASVERLEASGVSVSPAREIDVFITGSASRAALEAAGAKVRTVLPGVVTAYVPVAALDRIAALPDVTGIEGAARVEKVLNVSVPSTGATFLRGTGPSFPGLNGQGVIVGVVDTGIDYGHGDFQNPDGSTRLLSIWDQTDPGGPTPSGFAYGSEWLPADIDANVAREIDDDGHGTHVMGIAGGDGSNAGGPLAPFTFVGMAPRADLIAVKTNFSTGVTDGVAYIMNRASARGENAVANLSLGTLYGPKDGTSAFETGMTALCGPGHIVVAAAGNDGNKPYHAEVSAPANGQDSCTIQLGTPMSTGRSVAIDGYYEAGHTLSVTVRSPSGIVFGPFLPGAASATYPGTVTPNGQVYVENGTSVTSTGDPEVYIEFNLPNPNPTAANFNGFWSITFKNLAVSGAPVGVDLWTFHRSASTDANYIIGNRPDEKLLIEPANATGVITAGAWVTKVDWVDCGNRNVGYGSPWQVGMLALFSAPGPTRDGRQKPDITAPGIGVGAAQTLDVPLSCPGGPSSLLQDMQHVILEGTSMAAPHVSGAVALLLQKNGAWTPDQIKTLLAARAKTDGFTGAVWNNGWGNGKLFLGDLTDPIAHVTSPNGGETFPTGSNVNLTWTANDAYQGVTTVDLAIRRTTNGPFDPIATGIPNTGSYSWSVSSPITNQARLRVTAHDAAGNAGADTSDADFAIVGAADVGPGAIADFELVLRSPTPAPGAVDLEFAVPRSASVDLAVYDLAGRRLATLARGVHAAGRYRARWSGESGKAGVYFARLTAPGHELVRRIVSTR